MESGGHEDTQINGNNFEKPLDSIRHLTLHIDVFDRALSSKAILSNVDELVTVLLAKCDYKRRKIDWEDCKRIALPLVSLDTHYSHYSR